MKYKPEVWKLKNIIDKQQGIHDAQKEAHYVLGERTIEGSEEKPKKKTKKDDDANKRIKILETKIKRLTKRIAKLENGGEKPRPPCR